MQKLGVISFVVYLGLISLGVNAGLIEFSTDRTLNQKLNLVVPNSAQDYYLRGVKAISIKQIEVAKKLFESSLQKDSAYTRPLLGLAEAAFLENDNTLTKQYLMKALAIDDEDPYVLTSIGRYYYSVQEFPEAEKKFQKAISLKPNFFSAHIALADLYNNANRDYTKAEKAYRKSLLLEPDNSGANYALGVALLKQEKFSEAEESLIRASNLENENPLPLGMLGYLKYRQNRYKESLELYDSAIERNPEYIQGYFGKHDVFIAKNAQLLALEELKKVLSVIPNHPDALYKLGMIYQSKGKEHWNTAKSYYQNALASNPKLAAAYNNLAWITLKEGVDIEQALVWAKKANAEIDKVPSFLDTLAWVHKVKGESKEALKLLKQGISLDPSDPILRYHLGIVYYESGNIADAKQELETALDSKYKFEGYDKAKALLKKISSKKL